MKNAKFLHCIAVITVALVLVVSSAFSYAEESVCSADGIAAMREDTVEYLCGDSSVEDWVSTFLPENAGKSAEWYAFSLVQGGYRADFSEYRTALSHLLSADEVKNPVTELKCALVLCAVSPEGEADEIASCILEENTGVRGIMSFVFALHLMTNGVEAPSHTAEGVISRILELQLEDGGWAITGERSDSDTTAMVVQALSQYCDEREDVKISVEDAVDFLSESQLESGGFSSYGVENAESAAQAVIALCSLGIDPATDGRFVKEVSLFDAFQSYRSEEGFYSHLKGGEADSIATEQGLMALVAYERFLSGRGSIYVLDAFLSDLNQTVESEEASREVGSVANEEKGDADGSDVNDGDSHGGKITGILQIAVICSGAVSLILLFVFKKAKRANVIITVTVFLLLFVLVSVSDIRSPAEYYGETQSAGGENIFISISCDKIAGEDMPRADGTVLSRTEVGFSTGDTVYDILVACAKEYEISLDIGGSGESDAYILGIDGVYEFDHGDLSGWVYFVNGERPSVGCGGYTVSAGDAIEWHYSLDLGNDIKK